MRRCQYFQTSQTIYTIVYLCLVILTVISKQTNIYRLNIFSNGNIKCYLLLTLPLSLSTFMLMSRIYFPLNRVCSRPCKEQHLQWTFDQV